MVISGFLKEISSNWAQAVFATDTGLPPYLRRVAVPFPRAVLSNNCTRLILWSLSECHRKEDFLTFQPLSFSGKGCIIPGVYLPRRLTDLFEYLHSFCGKSPSLFLLHLQIRGGKKPPQVFQWHTNGANNMSAEGVGEEEKSDKYTQEEQKWTF